MPALLDDFIERNTEPPLSPHADAPGIRVCTGLTGDFRGPRGLH
ncbi:hypothetical protein BURMUCGD1_5258 [Burkholderia multivorans CGD1]|nr:hypothetical protein BURMUCGD1_5258 [Burkholderia multivorans CGD1]